MTVEEQLERMWNALKLALPGAIAMTAFMLLAFHFWPKPKSRLLKKKSSINP